MQSSVESFLVSAISVGGRSLFFEATQRLELSDKRTHVGGAGPFVSGRAAQRTLTIDCDGARDCPGELHRDPADRILVATARLTGASLVTSDERILTYARRGHVRS